MNSPLLEREGLSWRMPPVEALGNKDLKNGNPIIAIKRYTIALQDAEVLNDPHKRFILLLNRSQANLEIRLYGAAYLDALEARKLADSCDLPVTALQRSRVIWRLASALYELRLYDKASELAEECKSIPELGKTLPLLLDKISARKAERDQGKYDWHAILSAVHASSAPSIDAADYSGPVQVRAKPGGGVGIFLTRPVKRGELLIASKALAKCWPAETDHVALSILDPKGTQRVDHEVFHLVESLVGKVLDNPSLAGLLDGLPRFGHAWPGNLADAGNVAFASEDERLRALESAEPCAVDKQRLRDIVETNMTQMDVPLLLDDLRRESRHNVLPNFGQGLFGLPKLAKEVCHGGNITYVAFGDIMVCRASQDLPSGTELLYPIPRDKLVNRTVFLEGLLSVCDCVLCSADKKDDWRARAALVAEAKEIGKLYSWREMLSKLRAIAPKIEATYEKRERWMMREMAELWNEIVMFSRKPMEDGDMTEEEYLEAVDNLLYYSGVTLATPEQYKIHGRRVHDIVYPTPLVDSGLAIYRDRARTSAVRILLPSPHQQEELAGWERSMCWMRHLLYGGGSKMYRRQYKAILDRSDWTDWEHSDEGEWWKDP
ncbi:hypothetical protein IAT38_000318 [Cryptococcus sp. DSM 104549]